MIVWREGLWEKMQKYGVEDKFIQVCKTLAIYEVEASVLLEESSTRIKGQGCTLLPFYFYYGLSGGAPTRIGCS